MMVRARIVSPTEEVMPVLNPSALNIRSIDKRLRNRFKEWCAGRGINMTDAAIWLIELAVDGNPEIDNEIPNATKELA